MVAAPALPPSSPTRELAVRWIAQRLWIGPFLVPEHPFLVHPPCRACGGAVFCEDGAFRCLHCGRDHVVAAVSQDGRVLELALQGAAPRPTVRQLPLAYRAAREQSRREGVTGFAARVLRLVPRDPNAHVVVESLVAHLAVSRAQVRAALDELTRLGLLEQFAFAGGYRAGWRRPIHDPTESSP